MTPYERIEALYVARGDVPFLAYVDWYHRHGFVHGTPDYFIMARPVVKAATPEEIEDHTHIFKREECDCWYIHSMAGDMNRAWEMVPWWLPWFAFCRFSAHGSAEKDLRFYRADRIRSFTKNG